MNIHTSFCRRCGLSAYFCRNLPPPLRPDTKGSDNDEYDARGSLSDFSDYDSSDEESQNQRASSSRHTGAPYASSSTNYGTAATRKHYVNVSDDDLDAKKDTRRGLLEVEEDPFADPFADQGETASIASTNSKPVHWQ